MKYSIKHETCANYENIIKILCFIDGPKFLDETLGTFTLIEGETKNISLKAIGNPSIIKYDWTFPPGVSEGDHITTYKSTLNLNKVTRNEAGIYKITASNSYGNFTSSEVIQLDIHYPPS